LYSRRKETIERLFGTAKEAHGFRYTRMKGKARMRMKVGLTYACMNLKKLARMLQRIGKIGPEDPALTNKPIYAAA
ncbi:MAG: transposase, partial [Lachnospiraceae bacterium]|nr:transposase [Lachnospiraceae bacterium]